MRRQSLSEQVPAVCHEGMCKHCRIVGVIPIGYALLFRQRFMWICPHCWQKNTQRLSVGNARRLKKMFHRAGGTRISPEEIIQFRSDLRSLDDAVEELR